MAGCFCSLGRIFINLKSQIPVKLETLNYKSLFLDTEFTGLHQRTSLISLAIVADTGEYFYAEFNDYDRATITPWLRENVLDNLLLASGMPLPSDGTVLEGHRTQIAAGIKDWLEQLLRKYGPEKFRFWADVPHYDWVLFCELFGGSLNLPDYIDFMVMDLATWLYSKGISPDIPRIKLAGDPGFFGLKQHNALYDAFLARHLLLTLKNK